MARCGPDAMLVGVLNSFANPTILASKAGVTEASFDGVTWFPSVLGPGQSHNPTVEWVWTESPLTRGTPDLAYFRDVIEPPLQTCQMTISFNPDEWLDAVWVNGVLISEWWAIDGIGPYPLPYRDARTFPEFPGWLIASEAYLKIPDELITDGAPMEFKFLARHDVSMFPIDEQPSYTPTEAALSYTIHVAYIPAATAGFAEFRVG